MRFEVAKELGEAALACAARQRVPPLSVVVLDAGANIKFAATQDEAGPLRFTIALAKANAAIGMGVSTRQLFALFETGALPDRFAAAISAASAQGFAPQPGGELVLKNGISIGAIGISGASSEQDETIARAAVKAVANNMAKNSASG